MAWLELAYALVTARDEEEGQGLVEYSLIIGLVAIACIGALGVLSGKIGALMDQLSFN